MKIKICGIRHPEDAAYAAQLGADYIGVIFAAGSRREVSTTLAKEIASATHSNGAQAVGVFVNETAEQINSFCRECNIHIVQLHGKESRAALQILSTHYTVIYAISAEEHRLLPDGPMLLFDSSIAGSGQPFDWKNFTPPTNRLWILAGGLNPYNVATAIRQLRPQGIDVSSGVDSRCGLRKDPKLIEEFIINARGVS